MESIKRCTNCGRFLGSDSGFNWANKAKGYRQSECKKCQSVKYWIRRQCNLDYYRYRESVKWQKECDYLRKQHKVWYNRNKEYCHVKYLEWCNKNPNYGKLHYMNNKKRMAGYSHEYYLKNIEIRKSYHKQYRTNNKSKINNYNASRRSSIKHIVCDADKIRIDIMYYLCDFINKFNENSYEVDHIRPLSKGGLHHSNNLQILKADLNRKKYNKYPLTKNEKLRYSGITLKILENFKELLYNAKRRVYSP